MKLQTVSHRPDTGWSAPFPALDDSTTLVVAFGASAMLDEPGAIDEVRAAYPSSVVIGCSTSGEISGTRLDDGTLSVAVCHFEHTELRSVAQSISGSADSERVGAALGRGLADDDLRAVFVLSDGLGVNGTDLVAGLRSELGDGTVITGGLAGDGDRFERTWVLGPEGAASGQVVAVGLYGDRVRVGHGSQGGWDPFGPERLVTSSEGNVLAELDGSPALDLYKDYLGDLAAGLPGSALLFPLALRPADESAPSVVRTILAIDDEARTMTFAGDVPEGWRAQLMRANFDRLVDGAADAAALTRLDEPATGDVLALAISCVGRRLVLGERTEEELEAVADVLPDGAGLVGFYSYGELSPVAGGTCELHNQTMTLTTVWES